jgi:hypothetical protein
VANEPLAVLVTISVPSSEIMQARTSKRCAWPPKVPTDETRLCRLLAATAQGYSNDPGSDCSDGDGENSSADNPEEPPLRALRHALFAEWLINRHQHAQGIRAMVLVHNFAPPARRLHRYCAQRHAHETSGTINCDLRLDPSTSSGP